MSPSNCSTPGNRGVVEPFGSCTPFAEPAWYNALASPYYTDSHRVLRKYVREYVEANVEPYADQWEEDGLVPTEDSLNFIRAGLVFQDLPPRYRNGIPLPCNVPYEEWDIFHFIVLHFELAKTHAGVCVGLSGSSAIGAPPIVHFGTEEQKQRWLPGILTGDITFCLGATEPTGGSDLSGLKTTAVKDASGRFYIVNGNKKWITGAAKATHMTTAVRTGGGGLGGISVLVIETNSPGVTMHKIKNSGHNAANSQWVTLENVRVPAENLIGEENTGFATLMTNFNRERLIMAVNANSQARICLKDAYEYAQDRHTFGKPLISHQIIRAKLATIARYVEAHWAWIEQLAYHVKVNKGAIDDLSARIALAKVQGGRLLELANREAQQIFGGAGCQRGGVGSRVEQISRDLRVVVVGGGSEEILTDLAMRQEAAWAKTRSSNL
ncbi:acyl-CoA dehydrogenase/oxidase [Aspergillus cavernicola]|uniref:Acyl-CoA dehydrogenase/oxidase n=1 Tax=Aspergillus cavernicola TaxID=176166 RepID=A0ABR4I789_9EURO